MILNIAILLQQRLKRILLRRLDRQTRNNHDVINGWKNDPLSHPAIREMSMRELADLPVSALRPNQETCQKE